jgi:alpha-beta hydrolase superfamily lysophospholipase
MANYSGNPDYLKAADGTRLFYQSWLPKKSNNKVLAIVHGLGEHSGRYQHLADYFATEGFTLYALDLRGHGHSGGQRGHIQNFAEYRTDLEQFFQKIQAENTGKKCFLFGHSLGGLITLDFALHHPAGIAGVIVSSPGLQFKMEIPKIKQTLARQLSRIWPSLALSNGINPTQLSHDPAVVSGYIQDPLNHDRASARFFTEFVATMARTLRHAAEFQPPLLILPAGADEIVAPAGSQLFYDRVQNNDKQLIIYDGFYHEIVNEPDHRRVFADVRTWIEKH